MDRKDADAIKTGDRLVIPGHGEGYVLGRALCGGAKGEAIPVSVEVTMEGPRDETGRLIRYVFPSRSACPQCRDVRTEVYMTDEDRQYRRCAKCGYRYHENGQKSPPTG